MSAEMVLRPQGLSPLPLSASGKESLALLPAPPLVLPGPGKLWTLPASSDPQALLGGACGLPFVVGGQSLGHPGGTRGGDRLGPNIYAAFCQRGGQDRLWSSLILSVLICSADIWGLSGPLQPRWGSRISCLGPRRQMCELHTGRLGAGALGRACEDRTLTPPPPPHTRIHTGSRVCKT